MRLKKKNRSSTPRYWIKFQNKNLIKWSTSDINRCIHIDNSKKSLERENKTLNSVFWFLCLFGRSVANGAADQRRSRWIRSSGNLRVLQIYRYTHRERQGEARRYSSELATKEEMKIVKISWCVMSPNGRRNQTSGRSFNAITAEAEAEACNSEIASHHQRVYRLCSSLRNV